MKSYRTDVAEFESQRQELTNAEKLFELHITVYPELHQVRTEINGLEQIYDIYIEQKVGCGLFVVFTHLLALGVFQPP